MRKFHIKKGDIVKVISGNYRGEEGKVLEVMRSKERAIVESVNLITRHIKPSAANPQGRIEKTEAPVHISNLMLIDPATGEATRTGKKIDQNNKLRRYSKKTNELI